MPPNGFLIMGVSGSGKTTVGKALAQNLGWAFFDADDFHPPENITKMINGLPLSDSDRAPWLASLHHLLASTIESNHHPILACSALKEKYRAQLLNDVEDVEIIYLKGNYDLIWSRMAAREGHYMRPEMLRSQFAALEEPEDVLVLDVSMSVKAMIDKIMARYFLP
jgi:gluconokinase